MGEIFINKVLLYTPGTMKEKIALAILAIALLAIAGCTLPFDPMATSTTTFILEFSGNGSLTQTEVTEGKPLPDTAEWEGDCTAKYSEGIDMAVAMVTGATIAGAAQGQAPDANAMKMTAMLTRIKNGIRCQFTRLSDEEAVGELGMTFTREDVELMNEFAQQSASQMGAQQQGGIKVEDTPEGAIRYTVGTLQPGAGKQLVEVKVKVEGELVSLEPAGYVEEEGFYVYKDPATQLVGKDLVITYKPGGLDLFAFIPGGVFGLVGIIVVIAALGIVVLFILKRGRKHGGAGAGPGQVTAAMQEMQMAGPEAAPAKQPVKQQPVQQQAVQPVAQQPVQQPVQQRVVRETRPRGGNPWAEHKPPAYAAPKPEAQARPVNAPQGAMPAAAAALTLSEQADVATLEAKLQGIAGGYSKDGLIQSIVEGGFSRAVALEVAKRFGK